MKTRLLLFTLLISSILSAQEYCAYDAQIAINFGLDSADDPYQILELPDDQYLIVGTTYSINTNAHQAIVCRMNGDDTIDLTFGTNGRVAHTWDQRNNCITATLQSDGKILLGGYQAPGNGASTFRGYVARLNSDGSVDESFGEAGTALFDIQEGLRGLTVGIKAMDNGKIQAAVITDNPAGVGLYQINADGSMDADFGVDGLALNEDNRIYWQEKYGDALFLSDGSIVFVTKTYSDNTTKAFLSKVDASGELIMAFGSEGILEIETPIQYNFAGIHALLDADENIILGTTSEEAPKKYQISKISSETGAIIPEFGNDGMAVSTNSDSFNTLNGLCIDPSNGDIYAVGSSSNSGWGSSVWKINASGEEIDQCDGNAMFTYPFQFTNGMRVCKFLSSGILKLVGESGQVDESTPEDSDQDFNFFVPISSTNSLNEIEESNLSIYPNPVQNVLKIQLSNNLKIESYKILNQLGQVVQQANQHNQTINTAWLVPGVYFLEIYSSKGIAIRKFIKQ